MAYEFVKVANEADWRAYHRIRRQVLWEARGKQDYDATRPEEHVGCNHPLLLKLDERPIGTARLDDRGNSTGVVRVVAIAIELQRRGHGRVLSASVEDFARRLSLTTLFVNAASDATGFYEKMGWRAHIWDDTEAVSAASDCTQMSKVLRSPRANGLEVTMPTLSDFRTSLGDAAPAPGLPPAMAALWWAHRGEWGKAHGIVQAQSGADAAWVHAYLHRQEGDLGNAAYWYRQAGRPAADEPLEAEWEAIAAALSGR